MKAAPTQAELEARFKAFVDKAARHLAEDFVRLLNKAYELGICLYPDTDEDGTDYRLEWMVGQSHHPHLNVEWFAGMKRWAVVEGD